MHSFNIKSSNDFLQKLVEDFEALTNNPLSSSIAINCAMTAWHLTDWVFKEYAAQHGYNDLGNFRLSLDCPSLLIMHDIANGSKHLELSRPKSQISDTETHEGFFDSNFFDHRSFDVDTLQLVMEDGSKLSFTDEVEKAMLFWKNYIAGL